MEHTRVTAAELADTPGLDDWRVEADALHATFRAGSFSAGGALVAAISEAADAADHHPDLDLRYPGVVEVVLTTHAAGGLTTLDVDMARTISALAAGVSPEG